MKALETNLVRMTNNNIFFQTHKTDCAIPIQFYNYDCQKYHLNSQSFKKEKGHQFIFYVIYICFQFSLDSFKIAIHSLINWPFSP